MPHSLIVGRTMSGKTTLAVELAKRIQGQRPIIILDPNLDERWPKGDDVFLTHNRDAFLSVVKHKDNMGALVIVDESGETIGRYGGEMAWLATMGRHYGYQCIFISQRASQVDKNVRTQCANLFIFRQAMSDAKILQAEWADDTGVIESAASLQQGEFIQCIGFSSPVKRVLTKG